MSRFLFLRMMVLGWMGLLLGCGEAEETESPREEVVRTVEKEGVELRIAVSPKEPRLSDLVQMEIKLVHPKDVSVEVPAFGQSVGDFAVRDYSEKTSFSDLSVEGTNRESRVFVYVLEPMSSGRHLIRSIPVAFERGEDANRTRSILQSEPIELMVRSEIEDSAIDLAGVDQMLDPISVPARSWLAWSVLGILFLVLGSVIAFVFVRRRSLQETSYKPSPSQEAQQALDLLVREGLPQQGRYKEFYIRLTSIVRNYIEGTTGLKAPEQTTEEFLVEMRQSRRFNPAQSMRLQEFLEAADMVKYAGQQPALDRIGFSVDRAREFISTTFEEHPAFEKRSDTAESSQNSDRESFPTNPSERVG